MGYYTNYTLEIIEGNTTVQEFYEFIIEKYGEGVGLYYAVDEHGETTTETKWYTHREDMIEYSRYFPYTVFCLTGFGEENEDVWKEYYKGGKFQHSPAKMTFESYDENKLRAID